MNVEQRNKGASQPCIDTQVLMTFSRCLRPFIKRWSDEDGPGLNWRWSLQVKTADKSIRTQLEFLVKATGRSEAELVAQALEAGMQEVFRRHVTDAY